MGTFIPFTNNHKVTDIPIVLLLNEQNSYKLDAFYEAAFQNNNIIIIFPFKCIHKL